MAKDTTLREDKDLLESLTISIETPDFSDLLGYIQSNFEPEDIWDNGELDEWALAHGYIPSDK